MKRQRYPEQFPPEKTICKWRWSYPVIHMSRGEIRTCDKPTNITLTEEDFEKYGTDAFINNPYLIERRREKLEGFKHSDCFTCIRLEKRSIQSTRSGKEPFMTYMNEVVGRTENFEELVKDIPPEVLRADHPEILELSLSSLCNLKCLYCSPTYSTAWEDEQIKLGNLPASFRDVKAPPSMEKYFWEWFAKIKPTLKRVVFIGGEPLFNMKLYEYLDKMYELFEVNHPDEKIWINIISNFSVPESYFEKLTSRLPKLTQKFNFHIEASGESTGKRMEYIREGLDWNVYQKNIDKLLSLKQPGVFFGFQLAVNALCITSLKSLLEYAFELQNKYQCAIDFKQNIVVEPEQLSPYILPAEFATHIDDCITFIKENLGDPKANKFLSGQVVSHERWQELIPFLESLAFGIRNGTREQRHRIAFAYFILNNDRTRNRVFKTTFPEYSEFFFDCVLLYKQVRRR